MAEDVALKITLFRRLNNQAIGIMKLKMTSLPRIHHCFSASVCLWPCSPAFPLLNDFLPSPREHEGAALQSPHLGVVARRGKLLDNTDVLAVSSERCLLAGWALQCFIFNCGVSLCSL